MILIIADERDVHVPYVTKKLDSRGAHYLIFDPQHFPATAEISIRYDRSGSARRILNYKQEEVDLGRVKAVWNRAAAGPIADAKVKEEQRWWVSEGCSRFLAELWECIDCLWLPNRPIADREPWYRVDDPRDQARLPAQPHRLGASSAYNKLHQLAVAGQLGFTVPRTLVTNSPKRFLEFYEQCESQVVSKHAAMLRPARDGEDCMGFTYPVQRRNAADYQAIRYAPIIFQEEVPKKLELRVTVVAAKVFPAAIQSQESRLLRHDWRHYHDFGESKYYSVHTLPEKIEGLCVRLVETLGLCFGAMDLILTPEDEYVFLEVNPNGQWGWIENFTGLPISDAIADLLIQGTA
ncbi:MAG TPA: hypothetical protein VHF01_14435 [Candidatus Acidoferrum sp.]|nr:hypothetical protein [Candidatus Acidoferrum sp.]